MQLENKIAVVTGGGSGIGRAAAIAMGADGATIVIGNRSVDKGEDTCHQIEKAGGKALFHQTDCSSAEQCEALIARAESEFGRLDLTYSVMSKRILRRLVEDSHVDGWNDPRMPTLTAMRRRGYPASAIRRFCTDVGVTRHHARVQIEQLEHAVRDELNRTAPRVMAVLKPLRVVITNYPEGRSEELEAVNNPEDPTAGKRAVPFSRVLYIERDDFMEDPPRKFFRLAPGREVRLRYAYFIRCEEVVKDEAGEVVELRCTYDPETRGGDAPDGRKVKATLHWVSAEHAVNAQVRLYDRLFGRENPLDLADGEDFTAGLNPDSLEVLADCPVEPSLATAEAGQRFQFERLGYFCVDEESTPDRRVFNRTVTLRDTWARMSARSQSGSGT